MNFTNGTPDVILRDNRYALEKPGLSHPYTGKIRRYVH